VQSFYVIFAEECVMHISINMHFRLVKISKTVTCLDIMLSEKNSIYKHWNILDLF